jgi:hypothetical protein
MTQTDEKPRNRYRSPPPGQWIRDIGRGGFDREHAVFPEAVLAFIRETQPRDWAKLEALHGANGFEILT